MPKVLSYTPAWLSRPAPGHDVFSAGRTKGSSISNQTSTHLRSSVAGKPCSTIAHRGSEVFVAAGSEIRWTDLVLLSESAASPGLSHGSSRHSRSRSRQDAPVEKNQYRILKIPFSGQIQQLEISPYGDHMAIATTHTVHIAILPDPTHLGTSEKEALKLKTFQLGPTAHVLEQSPLASITWHPLGVGGRCVVTITQDGSIRLWEVDKDDRSSFSEPSFAINLQKLANAQSADDDLRASVYGSGKLFSPDMAELQVASACFGTTADSDSSRSWSSMTLWLATTSGDVYALCPLLPKKWQIEIPFSQETPLHELAAVICAKRELITNASSIQERKKAESQEKWFTELSQQIPTTLNGDGLARAVEVYSRPSRVSAIPKLQGPFQLTPQIDMEVDEEISDILVASLKDHNQLQDYEDGIERDDEAQSIDGNLVYLATSFGLVHCCLDLQGVDGWWLPNRSESPLETEEEEEDQALIVVESIALPNPHREDLAIRFTADVRSKHSVFVTHPKGVFYISLSKWVDVLVSELGASEQEGIEFRLDLLLEGDRALTDLIMLLPERDSKPTQLACCTVLEDSDIGHFVLFSADHEPYSASLDISDIDLMSETRLLEWSQEGEEPAMTKSEPRLPYQAPQAFWRESQLRTFYNNIVPARQRRAFAEEIKLGPASLGVLTELHRFVSRETHDLGFAAADLFRRCERLQDELRDQVTRASQVQNRIDQVTEENNQENNPAPGTSADSKLEKRVSEVSTRQTELVARYQAIRSKFSQAGGREMTTAERAFAEEVEETQAYIEPSDGKDGVDNRTSIVKRIEEVKALNKKLQKEKKELPQGDNVSPTKTSGDKIPSPVKKQKVAQVMSLLERETALVEATANRLGRLSMQSL